MEEAREINGEPFEGEHITKKLNVDDSEHLLSLFGINDENLELIKRERHRDQLKRRRERRGNRLSYTQQAAGDH